MEGERLLTAIKDKTIVAKDLKNYLGPLRSGSSQCAEKYQHFALKALKLVIQQLSQCSTPKDQQFHLQLSNILVSSIDKSPINNKNVPAISFEKLLVNLIHQAAKCSNKKFVESYSILVRDRLRPLVAMSEEAKSLLKCLSSLLTKIVTELEGLEWEKGLEMRLLSLEMSYYSYQNDLSDGNIELSLVKHYSTLLKYCLKKSELKKAINILKTVIAKSLYSNEDSIHMIVADFVKIRKLSKGQNNVKSLKEILIKCGCNATDVVSRFLEKELDAYECLTGKEGTPTDVIVCWKLDVLEELALIYKNLVNPPSTLRYGFVLVKKAVILRDQGDCSQSALEILSEAIDIAKSMQARSNEEKCMTFDLLGHCYFWKAMFLYSEMLKSTKNQSCDGDIMTTFALSVSSWKKVYSILSSIVITNDEIKNYFHCIGSSCNHLQLCVSLCSNLCLIPQALCSIDVLLFLYKLDSNVSYDTQAASLLAYKTRLLITSYGEKFVIPEVVSALEELVKNKECENMKCLVEAQLALALLYCKKGQFSLCNQLLKGVSSNSVFSKNIPDAYHLLAQLSSIASYYVEAQSEYIPLVDTNTCLTRLTTLPSPICIDCVKEKKDDCAHVCHHSNHDSTKNRLTELELSLDSLHLSKKLLKSYGINHSTEHSKLDSSETHDEIAALMVSPSSCELWHYVIQALSALLRVAKLYNARESVKEAVHNATEGLELAKLLHLRYWTVKFLLLISEIKGSLDKKDESSELKAEINNLLISNQCGDETDLSTVFNKLTLQPSETSDKDILSHPTSCCCLECTNPVRLVLVACYLHQLIEDHSNCDNERLLKCVDNLITNEWPKVCSSVDNSTHVSQTAPKRNSKTRKKPHSDSVDCSLSKSSEVIQPIVIKNASLHIQTIHNDRFAAIKEKIEMESIPLIHSPVVRLRLAELYYSTGIAKLRITDSSTLNKIYENPHPVKTISQSSSSQNTNSTSTGKQRHRRARRRIMDSDDEEDDDGPPKQESGLLPASLAGFVSDFLTSYQLLSPTTLSSQLTKRLYSVLGICLSIWQTNTAAHFLLHSSYLSFSMDAILWSWKKIRSNLRKQNCSNLTSLVIKDIQRILSTYSTSSGHTPSDYTCDDIITNLVTSRSILHSLTRPLPQSYTSALIQQLPTDWVYYNMTLVDRVITTKGDQEEQTVLILVRVAKDKDCIIVKLPLLVGSQLKADDGAGSIGDPVSSLHKILSESTQSIKLTDKRKWWNIRRKLNSEMEDFVELLQNEVFGIWKILLLNPSLVQSSSLSISRISATLSSCGIPLSDVWAEILIKGKDAIDGKDHLKIILQSLSGENHCCDSLVTKVYREVLKTESCDQSCPIVLSPCHPLHQLPFESMPLLRDHPVSRIPSLPFLTAHSIVQFNKHHQYINPRSTYYVVNPSGDLKNTEKMFGDWFKDEEGWEGVVGTPPTTEQFVYGFEERCVMIYCGHGRAHEYLKCGHIQELDCQATLLQMGCSSGKLETPGGDIEPNGMVLKFLLAGCPSLVVNLWDVTDVDIDRFCSTLVREWLSGMVRTDHYRLMRFVAKAREDCKLKYLVGASPVIYGTPLLTQH